MKTTALMTIAATLIAAALLAQESEPNKPRSDPFGPDVAQQEPGQRAPPAAVNKGRGFSAMQMSGEPDTPRAGDYSSCWAAAQMDVGKVWLDLQYARSVIPKEVWVYENCAPGAAYQVTGINDGEEFPLWRGVDPTPRDKPKGISKFRLQTDRRFGRIRVYMDCKAVTGWNEIDAVALVDLQGNPQWAKTAAASSTYSVGKQAEFVDPFADPALVLQESIEETRRLIRQQHGQLKSLQNQVESHKRSLAQLETRLEKLAAAHERMVLTPQRNSR